MYTFKEGIDKQEHDDFVRNHPLCNLLQSSAWADVKENWDSNIVGVYKDTTLVASSLVLIKRLPLTLTMLYTPRGPIMDYEDKELVSFFMMNLRKYAKKHHAVFVSMDPGIHYRDFSLGESVEASERAKKAIQNLKDAKAVHQGFSQHMEDTIQPRMQANVYKDTFDEDSFSKSAKKMLNIAQKKQVETTVYGIEKVKEFEQLMDATSKRKNIALRNGSYFERLLSIYKDDAYIVLAHINLEKRYNENKKRLEEAQEELSNCPENAKKKRFTLEELITSLTREVEDLKKDRETHGDIAYIAGALSISFGNTTELMYAGMDEHFKRYMAPYATWLASMKESFKRGNDWCNMGGVEISLDGGLTKFKANFNPTINEFVGEFVLPANPILYRLGTMAYKARK